MARTSIDRAFDVLDLFGESHPTLSPEDIADCLELTRSTAYRYLKILCDAGLLMQLSRGVYTLGPRVVELERKIHLSDPLLAVGRLVMPGHADAVPDSTLLLCGLWGERVLCLHQETARTSSSQPLAIRRARGLPFSLFKGAASLAILAQLPNARIKSLFLRHGKEVSAAGLGDSWADFRKRMTAIRKAGYCITTGTFDTNLTAVAAPLLNRDGMAIGSLTRILALAGGTPHVGLADGIQAAAADFSAHLASAQSRAHSDGNRSERDDGDLLGSITKHSMS